MPDPPSAMPTAAVVARLRAAGCVFAEDEAAILVAAATGEVELDAMVEERAAGTPLEQVVGWAEFAGLRVGIDPGVFVPRRRTEFLVQRAIELRLADATQQSVVLDLCCGTGALGLALAVELDNVELYAADIDPTAVRCARRNVAAVGGQVYESDLFAALPAGLRRRVDVLLANVPYVPTSEIALLPSEARRYEARLALDGGADGLDVLRQVTAAASRWLAPGGRLFFETSQGQLAAAVECVSAGGMAATVVSDDEWGATVIIGSAGASEKH